MRVWYDACTGKHMRYGSALAKRLRSRGYEVVLTTREHPDTVGVAKLEDILEAASIAEPNMTLLIKKLVEKL